jgi:hypothetical protein
MYRFNRAVVVDDLAKVNRLNLLQASQDIVSVDFSPFDLSSNAFWIAQPTTPKQLRPHNISVLRAITRS